MIQHKCSSKESLKQEVLEAWNNILPQICKKLVDSMPNRIRAVLRADDGAIKYLIFFKITFTLTFM